MNTSLSGFRKILFLIGIIGRPLWFPVKSFCVILCRGRYGTSVDFTARSVTSPFSRRFFWQMASTAVMNSNLFRECSQASQACSLTDCARLQNGVLMPWVGFGTYRLGKGKVLDATKDALRAGYRQIDTAFIYGGETTETLVGTAIQEAIQQGILNDRKELFITTKQWRSYHGYDKTLKCLDLSLKRLGVEYIDLWLMHHPGPAWKQTAKRDRGEGIHDEDLWHRTIHGPAVKSAEDMDQIRAETWRAMEDAYTQGKVRAIGVCNMTVDQLERLKKSARITPFVHQCEVHPLYPQVEMLQYCAKHNILVTAYASLGGQDTNRAEWEKLLGPSSTTESTNDSSSTRKRKSPPSDMLHAEPVLALARKYSATPAQILLRWALEQNCAIIPKTSSADRMRENTNLFLFSVGSDEVQYLTNEMRSLVETNLAPASTESIEESTRLCWRGDPLRTMEY